MKINKYIGLAAMPLFFAACQDDILDKGIQQNQPIYSLSGKMDKGVDSRAQIQLGNPDESGEIFMWNTGDSFAVYQGNEGVNFNISSDYNESGEGDKTSATFNAEVPVYPGSYVAVYPADVPLDDDNRLVFEFERSLDFSAAVSQEQKNAVWKEYFKNNMFMKTTGELVAEGPNTIQFQHLTSLVRITYRNESGNDQILNYVSLCGQDQFYGFNSAQNLDNSGGSGIITSWYELDFNGLSVAAGDTTDIYLLFFPDAFHENGVFEMFFSLQDGNRSVKVPVSEIAAANNNAEGFQAGMRYWFDVTSTKAGAILSKDYSVDPITFENVEFSAALKDLYPELVTIDESTGFASMIEADALSITQLRFGWGSYNLSSLSGIEKFKNLEYLDCGSNGVTECDLSQNTKLIDIQLSYNKLKELDLDNLVDLRALYCSYNTELASLQLENCSELKDLDVSNTNLTTLDIPNKKNIGSLGYGGTYLSFDLSEFTSLKKLTVNDLGLTSLDFIPNDVKAGLDELQCYENQIESIDLNEFPILEVLSISNNNLKSLDLSNSSKLISLECYGCYLEKLDITPLTGLGSLYCGQQKDGISLVLIATEEQKEMWRNNWSYLNSNRGAYLEGEEPEEIPEGSGSGSDFESGGEF